MTGALDEIRLPGASATPAPGVLLEREEELAAIAEVIAAAEASAGQVVVVEGEPGIGKTRLLEAVDVQAQGRGVQLLRGTGSELEQELAFGVVRQLLEPSLVRLDSAQLTEIFAGAAGLTGQLFGWGMRRGHDREGTSTILHGLYWLVANLSRYQPVLLAVDDAQWADAVSMRWLVYLARRLDGLPVSLVVTSRPGEGRDERWWLAALEREKCTHRIGVRRLSTSAVGVVVGTALGERATPAVIAACHAQTRGNPFFLAELLAELPAGVLTPEIVQGAGPIRVATTAATRLQQLGADARDLAEALAVLGGDSDVRLAAELAKLPLPRASLAAVLLTAAGIVAALRPLTFVHPIVREALYRHRPHGERALAHATAARLLARHRAPVARVAAHLLHTDPAEAPWVVSVLRAAAGEALRHGAPESAVAYLRRALAETSEPNEEVLLELGSAEACTRLPEARTRLVVVAREAKTPELRAAGALELARLLLTAGDAAGAVDALDAAIAGVGAATPELVVKMESERFVAALGSLQRSGGAVERFVHVAAPVAMRGSETPTGRLLLAQLAVALSIGGETRLDAVALARRALAGGRLLTEQGSQAPTYYVTCIALAGLGQLEACKHLTGALRAAQDSGNHTGYVFASTWRSWARMRAGDVRGAEVDAGAALELEGGEVGVAFNRLAATGVLVEALLERGDLAAAQEALGSAAVESGQDLSTRAHSLYAAGRLWLSSNEPARALEVVHAAGSVQAVTGNPPNPWVVPWRSAVEHAYAALGNREAARAFADEEVALGERFGAPGVLGIALRTQALVGDSHVRIERLSHAVSVLERSEARLEHARGLVELGGALRRAGYRRDARPPLRHGLDLAERCGATRLARRARDELLAAGARPRRHRTDGLDALTPAELRVAQHAAEGMTTREIAQTLFVTMKTVETHFGRAYRKLSVRSRDELRDVLATAT